MRLASRDAEKNRPPPVLVVFARPFLCDNFLRKKFKLAATEKYSEIFVNADEPADVRRHNGLFRGVAAAAKAEGENVWIRIDSNTFGPGDLNKIPPMYITRDFNINSMVEPASMCTQDDTSIKYTLPTTYLYILFAMLCYP